MTLDATQDRARSAQQKGCTHATWSDKAPLSSIHTVAGGTGVPEPVPYQYPARTPPVLPGPSTWRVLGSVHGQRRAWRTHIASPLDGWPRDASYPPWGVPARPCAKDAHLTPWKAWDRRQGGEVHRLSGPKEHHGRVEETDGVDDGEHANDQEDRTKLLQWSEIRKEQRRHGEYASRSRGENGTSSGEEDGAGLVITLAHEGSRVRECQVYEKVDGDADDDGQREGLDRAKRNSADVEHAEHGGDHRDDAVEGNVDCEHIPDEEGEGSGAEEWR
eukprot:CAMPEP_0181208878 /NCGR_PEP_ID=MMETSP1096-20121128/22359_1 /TAXON_ID=156174 ORGANISM="Chrysochromulina ericina, Strain CCMP281" /NCGR_SAMPLE_ID=MMETSP1096 /ASSEMBLY_ACC=CAM_ASM_000453 /LENGTH=273 /DNA_ID=CAMNT_0023299985 /DNA_START=184 /DNA_END=1001 /DNA_ORIENTATION=-